MRSAPSASCSKPGAAGGASDEPEGGPAGYAESFDRREANEAHGTYTAPFSGIHGWYWLNKTGAPVTVTLKTSGFYNLAHEFRTGQPVRNKTFQ